MNEGSTVNLDGSGSLLYVNNTVTLSGNNAAFSGKTIIGDGRAAPSAADRLYSDFGRSTLLTFGEPYRAEAFVAGLEQRAPGVQLDWFREGTGEFAVVLVYEDRDAFDRSAARLRHAGFRLD